ncbi:hypothetical protein PLESTB_001605900 [Pleodorina starrii]|uniref:Inositol polyphosphate-related phosphatase domain-containing protein n=1 Tax=Pleodorina starrii TaxID=330485 RepID=A0A9W6BYC9_9CHLO|nr:hypothetical protein PLESTB_001605900 [Pleodorina starrii]
MKKLLVNLGGKVAALADDIASYNDPTRQVATSKPLGPGSGAAGAGGLQGGLPAGPEQPLDAVLEHLLRNVRSRHVRQHFTRTHPAEYTQQRSVTIQAATFNVAGKKPPPGLRLDEWLGAGPAAGDMKGRWPPGAAASAGAGAPAAGAPSGGGGGGPDILAVGFVELVPLNAGNVMGVWGNTHVEAWDRCLAVYLNGEEWATQRYGPAAPAPVGQAAAAAAASALYESKWQGGEASVDGPPVVADSSSSSSTGAVGAGNGGSGFSGRLAGVGPEEYVQVASKQLVGVYLSVWVRRRLLPEVRGVQVTTVATGFGGYLGNKGAVAARMRLFDSSLVFVAAHLTAGEAEGDELRRNADVADILRRALFASAPDGGGAVAMTAAPAALISTSLGQGHWPQVPAGITDHDMVIWCGDLNYRIATVPTAATASPVAAAGGAGETRPAGLTDADVRAAIRAGRLEPLLAADQLNRERAAGRVFRDWHEGRITFLPTYKFKAGTHTYNGDDLSGALAAAPEAAVEEGEAAASTGPGSAADAEKHKRRTPAWCDRVLWWTRPRHSQRPGDAAPGGAGGGGVAPCVRQLAYWRGELTVSDHKPVSAAFVADLVSYDRRRIEGILEAGMRAVDRMQESLRPRVTVEPVVLEAGEWVALGRPTALRLHITNTGTVEAIFHFIPAPQPEPNLSHKAQQRQGGSSKFGLDDETPPLPPWLVAQPAEGVVLPGQSCEMELAVLVEGGAGGAAAQLSEAGAAPSSSSSSSCGSLDSILILRIEDSGDKFITIGGRYRRSFLGMSLEALARLGPAPALPPTEAAALAGQLGLGEEVQAQLQEAGGAPSDAGGADDDGTVAPPKELRALVSALMADSAAALRVPGILADSTALVLARAGYAPDAGTAAAADAAAEGEGVEAAAMQPTGREAQRALIRQLEPLRLILDAGGRVPASADPHDVAALLLLWCGQLPQPLIPAAVADAAADAPPASPADAAAMLRRHCGPHQLAAVAELLRLLRAALGPSAADRNGLTAARLAAAAAAWWMPPLAAGAGAGAASGQRALLTMLLEGGGGAAAAAAAAGEADD